MNIHPAAKNTLEYVINYKIVNIARFDGKGKPQKKLSKTIAVEELSKHGDQVAKLMFDSQKKKDDLSDAIGQFKWWLLHHI